jgi:hypothetical protein
MVDNSMGNGPLSNQPIPNLRAKLNSSVKPFNPSAGTMGSANSLSGSAASFTPNSMMGGFNSDAATAVDRLPYGTSSVPPGSYGYSSKSVNNLSSSTSSGGTPYGSGSLLSNNLYAGSRSASAPAYTAQSPQAYSSLSARAAPILNDPAVPSSGGASGSASVSYPFPRTSPIYSEFSNTPGSAGGVSLSGLGNSPATRMTGATSAGLSSGLGVPASSAIDLARSPHGQQLHGLPHQSLNLNLPAPLSRSASTPMYLSQQSGSSALPPAQHLASAAYPMSASHLYNNGFYESR